MSTPNGSVNGATNMGNNDTLPMRLVNEMQAIFGKHPGYRTTHAKGLIVEGKFTPTEKARDLSTAQHFNSDSTPVIARFSVGGGIPRIPDANVQATPKGLAIRFKGDNNTHTDLISHSFNGFATRTGEDFLSFLQHVLSSNKASQSAKEANDAPVKEPERIKKAEAAAKEASNAFAAFLASHPSAHTFVASAKPNPINYGTITYYEPNTHVLTNKDGKVTNIRYRLNPVDGEHLHTTVDGLGVDYLEDDLQCRFPGKPIVFNIQAHIAGPHDVLDDATILYKSTEFIPIGKLEINKVMDNNTAEQKQIAFSASPEEGGIKGVKSSNDPLIQIRKGVYGISASQRRQETQLEKPFL